MDNFNFIRNLVSFICNCLYIYEIVKSRFLKKIFMNQKIKIAIHKSSILTNC